jgi:hypothetical protein
MTEQQFRALAAWIEAAVIAKVAPYQDNFDAAQEAKCAARAALVTESTNADD